VCVSLVVARIVWTGRFHYAFLVWNLFLAWLPLVFALLANDEYRNAPRRTWRFYGLTDCLARISAERALHFH